MKFDSYQPFYIYLSDEAVQSLNFRVVLRKISDSPIASSRVGVSNEGYVPSNCCHNSAIVRTISWQEKLLEPRQAITRLREKGLNESLDSKSKHITARYSV